MKTNPSYVEAFHEIQDPMEKFEQLLVHEEDIIKDVPLVEFERRRNVGSWSKVENITPLGHLSPHPTLEICFSVSSSITIEDDVEEGEEDT